MDTSKQHTLLIPDGGRTFQTDYHNESPVQAIVRALSTIENCPAENAPRFYQYADPDAMNRLMETARDSDQEITVELTVEEYSISIDSDGTISISDPEADSEDVR